MEESLLSSAIQQCLADNPRLEVEVHPPERAGEPDDPTPDDTVRTVRIALLDDPLRIAFRADGREWIVAYRSLDALAHLLANLEKADVEQADVVAVDPS